MLPAPLTPHFKISHVSNDYIPSLYTDVRVHHDFIMFLPGMLKMSFHSYPGVKVHNNRKVKKCMLLVIHSQHSGVPRGVSGVVFFGR